MLLWGNTVKVLQEKFVQKKDLLTRLILYCQFIESNSTKIDKKFKTCTITDNFSFLIEINDCFLMFTEKVPIDRTIWTIWCINPNTFYFSPIASRWKKYYWYKVIKTNRFVHTQCISHSHFLQCNVVNSIFGISIVEVLLLLLLLISVEKKKWKKICYCKQKKGISQLFLVWNNIITIVETKWRFCCSF